MFEGRNISYRRGFFSLFSNLSFVLEAGQSLAIKGVNGSGKSTFLRLLAGLIRPAPHTLFWQGKAVTPHTLPSFQHNLLYVGHKLCLSPEALVKDQSRLWQDLYKIPEKMIEEALEIWGLSLFRNKKIAHLSQGQQKRLSLSRCCWLNRSLWLLDEPHAGLDTEGKSILSHVLSQQLDKRGLVVFATHESMTPTVEIHL